MSEAERPDWALRGAKDRKNRILTSLNLTPEGLEQTNLRLQARLAEVQRNEVRWEEELTDDAELLLVAFGTVGRICKSALRAARRAGLKVGLLRPISLWPFPEQRLYELAGQVQRILVVEMNAGQMLQDVREAVAGRAPVALLRPHGRHDPAARRGQRADRPADVVAGLASRRQRLSTNGGGLGRGRPRSGRDGGDLP